MKNPTRPLRPIGAGNVPLLGAVLCLISSIAIESGRAAHAQVFTEASPAQAAEFLSSAETAISGPDQTLWSAGRIEAFGRARPALEEVVAVLRVPRLRLEAPVFEGALESELDRGPGWIRGTAPVGQVGNVGIAGHRTGYFRVLKDIEPGDTVEVLDRGSLVRYRVTDTWIVEPDAVHVLDPTEQPSITLVTCYPFYFVGSAPQRFIVRAVRSEA